MVADWQKFIRSLDLKRKRRVELCLITLQSGDWSGLNVKRLIDGKSHHHFRCRSGDVRIDYYLDGNDIRIKAVSFRKDAYKKR